MAAAPSPPAPMGWRADPWHRHQARFHDGTQWTEHVADGGICGLDSTPVADLPRSRPRPAQESPRDDLGGPRVVDDPPHHRDGPIDADPVAAVDRPLLLLDEEPDDVGARRLRLPDDSPAGRVLVPRGSWLTRLGRSLLPAASHPLVRLTVVDEAGGPVLSVERPARRTEPVVDVVGPREPLGRVTAASVRRGLDARVETADGTEVGRLEQVAGRAEWLRVVGPDDAPLARTTPVWDVPGDRWALPPGVVLVDRRPVGDDALRARLLLGALLSAALLLPPTPAPTTAEATSPGRGPGA